MEHFLQLFVLFLVIVDPLASCMVFLGATKDLALSKKLHIAIIALIVAFSISLVVLLFGEAVITLLNTSMEDIRVAGGIMLGILGVKMALGGSLTENEKIKDNNVKAIASIIGTPLLTGPAAITAIIISSHDYGMVPTGIAFISVLLITAILFYIAARFSKFINETVIQVTSTVLGIITLAWGVMFIRAGLGL